MMRSRLLSLFMAFCFLLGQAFAQSPSKEISSREFNEATNLAKKAKSEFDSGNFSGADLLINESIKTYPTPEVLLYARAVGEHDDISGANRIMDLLIDAVRVSPGYKKDIMGTTVFYGKPGNLKFKTIDYSRERCLFNFMYEAYKINNVLGEVKWIRRSMQRMAEPKLVSYNGENGYLDGELENQLAMAIQLEMFNNNFDKALAMAQAKQVNNTFTQVFKDKLIGNIELSRCYYENTQESYARAMELLANREPRDFAIFALQAMTGKNEEARRTFSRIPVAISAKAPSEFYFALIDINEGRHKDAIAKLNSFREKIKSIDSREDFLVISRNLIYKALGDAYLGLKDMERARDYYNLSLLYFPDYKPTIEALGNLERLSNKAFLTDKQGPQIVINEPTNIKADEIKTSLASIQLKGVARDVSGLKEMRINGQLVYSQKGGDF
ncbi:hypothetical protein [Pedobacter aquatilis]|uniref:hypothetical protein n=1 Tax=Pedobacter aquatilis TaxID=351343 RepID=UPI0029311A28|nr:hypothetical protein [Pedobacter aquatilis]